MYPPGMNTGGFPVINPDDPAAASPLAQALLAHRDDPDAWVFTDITDWGSPAAKDIRYEVSNLLDGYTVKFRGAVHNGVRGTAMHVITREQNDAEIAAKDAAREQPPNF